MLGDNTIAPGYFAGLLHVNQTNYPSLYKELENCKNENEAITVLTKDILKEDVDKLQHPDASSQPTPSEIKPIVPSKTEKEILALFRKLHVFQNNKNTDDKIKVKIKGESAKEFVISKKLLKNESEYFKTLFAGGFRADEKNEILLDEIDPEIAEMAFTFLEADDKEREHFFDNRALEDLGNILEVRKFADRLDSNILKETSEKAIQRILTAVSADDLHDVMKVRDFAISIEDKWLTNACESAFFDCFSTKNPEKIARAYALLQEESADKSLTDVCNNKIEGTKICNIQRLKHNPISNRSSKCKSFFKKLSKRSMRRLAA